jgi:tRNA threonylcarbamoyladenosine biosynthesis protein TsaE
MSTALTWQTSTSSSKSTEQLGERIGSRLRGGEVIELISDLGGGKTTLTRGIVRGADSQDPVRSPTFTLSNQYKAAKFTIYHFDFYRLSEAGVMADELAEVIGDPKAVAIVEWGEIVTDVLPASRLSVKLTSVGENSRKIEFKAPDKLKYLLDK